MTRERWATVERLYQEALARGAGERTAFLGEACAGDDALRREVVSLLDHDGSAAFLSTPAAAHLEHTPSSEGSLIGHSVGSYAISAWLGAGGMGEVYRARDSKLGRDVAIKILAPEFTSDPERLARFAREAHVLASLNHPHIGAIYGLEDAPTGRALVLELVEGPTLADRIARGRIPIADALAIARQIADALEAVHETGIVHRDLKPGNIKITALGVVKVLDFGLAKEGGITGPDASQSQTVSAATREGLVLGTAAYMSPEQARGQKVDKRTDIWAFGCVLYEMLAGRAVFSSSTMSETLAAILDRDPDWKALPSATPVAVRRLLRRCLEKDPKLRLHDIADARLEVDDALRPKHSGRALPPRARWLKAAAAAAVVSAAVLGAWAFSVISRFRQPAAVGSVLRLQLNPTGRAQFGALGYERPPSLALSPDGKTAVYSAIVDGTYALWLHPLDGTGAHVLSGSEDARWPFWSPDGRSIAFFSRGKLWRIDIAGGTPLAICDVPTVYGGAWAPDGRILVGLYGRTIASVPASGGTLKPLTALDSSMGDVAHVWPQVLPGGHFLYWAASSNPEDGGGVVYAASFEKPNQRVRLVATETQALFASGPNGLGYLLLQRGGKVVAQQFDGAALKPVGEPRPITDDVGVVVANAYMAVAVSTNGTLLYASPGPERLTWFDRAGKPLGTVGDPGLYAPNSLRISPDGSQIAVTRMDAGRDLWQIDAERGTSRRMTYDSGGGYYPQWSPDGRTLLFLGENISALHRKDAAGAAPGQRLATWPVSNLADWSRDGGFLLYTQTAETKNDIWVVPVTPDGRLVPQAQPRPYLRTPFNEFAARFSPEPNPRWVAYQSDESGRAEVYVQSFPQPRGPHRISANGGSAPQWGPDGRELFYRSMAGKIEAVSVRLGADSIEASAPRELFALPQGVNYFAVAPDGRRFLVRVPDPNPRPLTVIVNWPAMLTN